MSIEIGPMVKKPSRKAIEGFRKLLDTYGSITPGVSDCMNRLNAMDSDIKPLFPGIRLVGVALTVKTSASDIAPVIKALEFIEPGNILIVDTHDSKNTAFWGEIVAMEADRKGAAGIILDGAVRDVVELKEMKFPVLCKGIAPNVAGLVGFGEIHVPVQCGGAAVSPGDIVIVDDNGVVVVPCDHGDDVLDKTRKFLENEVKIVDRVKAGETLSQILGMDRLELKSLDHTRVFNKS